MSNFVNLFSYALEQVIEDHNLIVSEDFLFVANERDFFHVVFSLPAKDGRSIGVNVRIDSCYEGSGAWPYKAIIRLPKEGLVEVTKDEAVNISTLLAAAVDLTNKLDKITGNG